MCSPAREKRRQVSAECRRRARRATPDWRTPVVFQDALARPRVVLAAHTAGLVSACRPAEDRLCGERRGQQPCASQQSARGRGQRRKKRHRRRNSDRGGGFSRRRPRRRHLPQLACRRRRRKRHGGRRCVATGARRAGTPRRRTSRCTAQPAGLPAARRARGGGGRWREQHPCESSSLRASAERFERPRAKAAAPTCTGGERTESAASGGAVLGFPTLQRGDPHRQV